MFINRKGLYNILSHLLPIWAFLHTHSTFVVIRMFHKPQIIPSFISPGKLYLFLTPFFSPKKYYWVPRVLAAEDKQGMKQSVFFYDGYILVV